MLGKIVYFLVKALAVVLSKYTLFWVEIHQIKKSLVAVLACVLIAPYVFNGVKAHPIDSTLPWLLEVGEERDLHCQDVITFARILLHSHIKEKKFNDNISQMSLAGFIEKYDPLKIFFMKQDVERFEETYGTVLDDELSVGNCDALYEIVAVYRQRTFDRGNKLAEMVMREFDFSRDEVFDKAKKRDYAASEQEWDELWRKYIKMQYLPHLNLSSMAIADIGQIDILRYKFSWPMQSNGGMVVTEYPFC